MIIRTVIVDDEPLARDGIREFLDTEADIEIVAEARNGSEAVAAIEQHGPDLVFLDIQMPEIDGFGVLQAVGADRIPAVIFVTAYDEHALRAFQVHALDYLLKPVDRERFRQSLERARAQLQYDSGADVNRRVVALLEDLRAPGAYLERLVVKSRGRVFFLRANEVDWVEAAGNYVKIHVGGERHLIRETMGELESQLDPKHFARVHRSSIVNLDRVKEIQPWFKGEHVVLLEDGTQLSLSRKYREKLESVLGRKI